MDRARTRSRRPSTNASGEFRLVFESPGGRARPDRRASRARAAVPRPPGCRAASTRPRVDDAGEFAAQRGMALARPGRGRGRQAARGRRGRPPHGTGLRSDGRGRDVRARRSSGDRQRRRGPVAGFRGRESRKRPGRAQGRDDRPQARAPDRRSSWSERMARPLRARSCRPPAADARGWAETDTEGRFMRLGVSGRARRTFRGRRGARRARGDGHRPAARRRISRFASSSGRLARSRGVSSTVTTPAPGRPRVPRDAGPSARVDALGPGRIFRASPGACRRPQGHRLRDRIRGDDPDGRLRRGRRQARRGPPASGRDDLGSHRGRAAAAGRGRAAAGVRSAAEVVAGPPAGDGHGQRRSVHAPARAGDGDDPARGPPSGLRAVRPRRPRPQAGRGAHRVSSSRSGAAP